VDLRPQLTVLERDGRLRRERGRQRVESGRIRRHVRGDGRRRVEPRGPIGLGVDQLQHADDLPLRRAQRFGQHRFRPVSRVVVEAPVEHVWRVRRDGVRVVDRDRLAGLRDVASDRAVADREGLAAEWQVARIVLRNREPQPLRRLLELHPRRIGRLDDVERAGVAVGDLARLGQNELEEA
jgi:hypothetical protein